MQASELLLQPIFTKNNEIDKIIESQGPEPVWDEVFFNHLPKYQIPLFIKMIQKAKYMENPYFLFLNGLQNEFGIETEIDFKKALLLYEEGAKLNEPYCLYRLYFLSKHNDKKELLDINPESRDQEMLFLIKSTAYFNYYADERFKSFPVHQLAVHLDREDINLEKCHALIRRTKNLDLQKIRNLKLQNETEPESMDKLIENSYNDLNHEQNNNIFKHKEKILHTNSNKKPQNFEARIKNIKNEYDFLDNWLNVIFPVIGIFNADDANSINSYERIKYLAFDEKYPEACFLLAEMEQGHLEGGTSANDDRIEGLLKFCMDNKVMKSFSSLASFYEKRRKFEQAADLYHKAGQFGCFRGLYEYAGYLITGTFNAPNLKKGIKYLIRAFWLGYMYSVDNLVLILNRNSVYQQNLSLNEEQIYQDCFEISKKLFENHKFLPSSFINHGPHYYLYSICLERGISFANPDLDQALEVLNKGIGDSKVGEKKYLDYRLGRIYYKKREIEIAQKFLKNAFEAYALIIRNEKTVKYPAQFYRVGKMYENGWGSEKNLFFAREYYKRASSMPNNCFFLLQNYYHKKGAIKYEKLKESMKEESTLLEPSYYRVVGILEMNKETILVAARNGNVYVYDSNKYRLKEIIAKAFYYDLYRTSNYAIKMISFKKNYFILYNRKQSLDIWNPKNKKMAISKKFEEWFNDIIKIKKIFILGVHKNRIFLINLYGKSNSLLHEEPENNGRIRFKKIIYIKDKKSLLLVDAVEGKVYHFLLNWKEKKLKLQSFINIYDEITNIIFSKKINDVLLCFCKDKILFIGGLEQTLTIKEKRILSSSLFVELLYDDKNDIFVFGDSEGKIFACNFNEFKIKEIMHSNTTMITNMIALNNGKSIAVFSFSDNYVRIINKNFIKESLTNI